MMTAMTIRTHLSDLRERRDAYARLLETLKSGKLLAGDQREYDLRRKIADLDAVIEAEAARRA